MTGQVEITQFMRPNGRPVAQRLEVDGATLARCLLIKESGYWFECEVLMDGTVSITITDDDKDHDIELIQNVPDAFLDGFRRMVGRFSATLTPQGADT